jgi:hypothetical protein
MIVFDSLGNPKSEKINIASLWGEPSESITRDAIISPKDGRIDVSSIEEKNELGDNPTTVFSETTETYQIQEDGTVLQYPSGSMRPSKIDTLTADETSIDMVWEGTINYKWKIKMSLNRSTKENAQNLPYLYFSGNYMYLSTKKPISLAGSFFPDDENNRKKYPLITITERVKGAVTGHFIGYFLGYSGTFQGIWTDGKKSYPFYLEREK